MLSISHLIIVFVVALVVFGPEKLPELARNLGKLVGEFRRATGDLRSTFEGHLRDLEREADQRRATAEIASAATPVDSSAPDTSRSTSTMQESPPAPPVVGTIATTPPHLLAFGTPEGDTAANTIASENGPESASLTERTESSPPSEEQRLSLETDHSPETLTDAGTRPA